MARLVDAVFIFVMSGTAFAQGGRGIMAHNPANDNKPYDKHDISGIWTRNGSPGGYGGGGTCRDCGDRGYAAKVPPLTAFGKKMFDANKPSYGRLLGARMPPRIRRKTSAGGERYLRQTTAIHISTAIRWGRRGR